MDLTVGEKSPTSFPTFLDSFALKIIAIVCMTLDHIARLVISTFAVVNETGLFKLCLALIIVGRIAFILFSFLCVKSMAHTRSRPKYLLRLGIMTLLIGGMLCLTQYVFKIEQMNNIFLTLFLGGLVIYLLENKRVWAKPLAILPFIYVALTTFYRSELSSVLYPELLLPQYEFYGLLMIFAIYLSQKAYKLVLDMHDNNIGNASGTTASLPQNQLLLNTLALLAIVVVNVFAWGISFLTESTFFVGFGGTLITGNNVQFYSLLSLPIIFCYNEQVGYNKKWFKYFTYAYYPLHILVSVIIIYVISMTL